MMVNGKDKDKGKEFAEQRTVIIGVQQHNHKQMKDSRSYENVVATCSKSVAKRWTLKLVQTANVPSCLSVQLMIPMEKTTWLTKTWVGRLRNLAMFDRLEEEFMWEGGASHQLSEQEVYRM